MTPRRVILVGATGTFGRRLALLLARRHDIELVLTARRREPLDALCGQLRGDGAAADISSVVFDRDRPHSIRDLAPWLVIDAAGPFQSNDHAFPNAVVDSGAHYIDLADARDFVAGFAGALDAAARARAVLAVTGASSTPALSHAALAELVAGWGQVDDVVVAISPGAQAPIGLSVVQAILSYAGKPVRVFSDGRWREAFGWSGTQQLDMPGLGRRWVALCETPDLDLLPARFPIRRNALFLAGLELAPMHLGLTLLALPVRWGLLRSLRPLAALLRAVARRLQGFGSDRGGMMVTASGIDADGRGVTGCWALIAEANAGPNVPVAAAAALTSALCDGTMTTTGAQPCVGLLARNAILAQLNHLPITTRTNIAYPHDPALFRRLLGPRMDDLPPAVRIVHAGIASATFTGRAIARAGRHPLAQFLARIFDLPRQGHHTVSVRIDPDRTGETWTRRFGDTIFFSRLTSTATPGLFEEAFGPISFTFEMMPSTSGTNWKFQRWRLVGIAMPMWAAPRIRAQASQSADRYRFSVAVAHPWLGLMFAYRGTLDVPNGMPQTEPLAKPIGERQFLQRRN